MQSSTDWFVVWHIHNDDSRLSQASLVEFYLCWRLSSWQEICNNNAKQITKKQSTISKFQSVKNKKNALQNHAKLVFPFVSTHASTTAQEKHELIVNDVWFLCCPSWSSLHRISREFPARLARNPITASERNKTICLDFLHPCREEESEENCASGLMKGRGGAEPISNIPQLNWVHYCTYTEPHGDTHS